MNRNEFRFGGAFGIDFLFVGGACDCTGTKSKEGTSMSATVIVDLMGSINIPMENSE
jgi:hypothetical protein